MTDYQLSNEDHEALEKFTKFFLVKAAQIIVQSRLGEKKTTKSKPVYSGSEWVQTIKEASSKDCARATASFLVSPFDQGHSRSDCEREKMPGRRRASPD